MSTNEKRNLATLMDIDLVRPDALSSEEREAFEQARRVLSTLEWTEDTAHIVGGALLVVVIGLWKSTVPHDKAGFIEHVRSNFDES